MSNWDRMNAEDIQERYDVLRKAVEGLADRVESLMLMDDLERYGGDIAADALWHLDVLSASGKGRGLRMDVET